ncbi:MAG: hypothetical protein AAFZ15_08855 [Bacteroidota bacterium]
MTRKIYEVVHNMIIEKCKEKPDFSLITQKGASLYGFGKFSNVPNTIKGIMLESEAVKDYMNKYFQPRVNKNTVRHAKFLNGKFLYDRYRDLKNEKETIEFSGLYQELFFRFIGYRNIEVFLDKIEQEGDKVNKEEINIQRALIESLDDGEPSRLAIEYHGYYYSINNHETPFFTLKVDFYKEMIAQEDDFHDAKIGVEPKNYRGKGRLIGGTVYFNLKNAKNNVMNIFIYRGEVDLRKKKYFRGCFMTISSHGYPVYGKVVFLNVNELGKGSPEYHENKLWAQRELFYDFKNFRVSPRIEDTLKDISVNKTKLRVIEPMVGVYIVWSFTNMRENILQSIFIIKENFHSTLRTYHNDNVEEQVCLIRLANGTNGKNLYVSTHEQRGLEARNTSFIEMELRGGKFTKGSFCSIADQPHPFSFNRAGYMVMVKINEAETDKYQPFRFRIDTLRAQVLPNDANLQALNRFLEDEFDSMGLKK